MEKKKSNLLKRLLFKCKREEKPIENINYRNTLDAIKTKQKTQCKFVYSLWKQFIH